MVEKSGQKKRNSQNLEVLIADWSIIPAEELTAKYYARVHANLVSQGRVAKVADMWIAAHAWQYDTPLVSRDKHFDAIDQIKIIRWPTPPTTTK